MNSIAYLVADSNDVSDEERAGWQFLGKCSSFQAQQLLLADLPEKSSEFQVLWWHFDRAATLPELALDESIRSRVVDYVKNGGSLFLSLLATQWLTNLGLEPQPPDFVRKGLWRERCWAEDYPDIRGFASYQGHAIFDGLQRGVFTWLAEVGKPYSAACYRAPAAPRNGRVAAVGRSYISINDDWRLVTEHRIGKGQIVSVGAFLYFADGEPRFRPHLEHFSENCLRFLSGDLNSERNSYWQFEPLEIRKTERKSKRLSSSAASWQSHDSGLKFERASATEHAFDVGGRRLLILGAERGGLSEVWCHPVRILHNLRLGFEIRGSDVLWSDMLAPDVTVRPESLIRRYRLQSWKIEETVFSELNRPAGALHIQVQHDASQESTPALRIHLSVEVDLRLMWPYPVAATGSLAYAWDDGLQAAVVKNQAGDLTSVVGASRGPVRIEIGPAPDMREELKNPHSVAIDLIFCLQSQEALTLAFAGSHLEEREAVRAYRRTVTRPAVALREQARHFKRLLNESTVIISPDPEFNQGYRWALAATDRFFVETPGLGRSLMAGFANSAAGWHGNQDVSGRPGYGWYFGRDAIWTAFAVLNYGDFEKVRRVLEFLGRHQDITGKILHECTTSGQVHLDAADATPLYVVLMGRYLRASGDLDFAREQFPRIRKAMEFCLSTDSDGDGLIENTHVGHGWVEGGKLFPTHCELYLAACWGAALHDAARLAEALAEDSLAQMWREHAVRVKQQIRGFFNSDTGFYNFARNADGSYNSEKTVAPAVAIYFDQTEPERARACLEAYAGAEFSADWGVRMVSRESRLYNPRGYHYGSVWPLFTGWVSLAEFKSGRPVQGFVHLMNNLRLYRNWSVGYVPEVLHGERFEPAGVCAHQAWSEAMVLLPALEGMLGLKVDALESSLELRPAFPADWPHAEVKNIRIGNGRVDLRMERQEEKIIFRFKARLPRKIAVNLQPVLSLPSRISSVFLGRKKILENVSISDVSEAPWIRFELERGTVACVVWLGG